MIAAVSAVIVVTPATVSVALSVMLPPAVTLRVPAVPPPRIMALESLRLALVRLPLAGVPKVTVPKLLDCVERSAVIAFVSAVMVVTPDTVSAPLSVMAPPAVTLRVPAVPPPRTMAPLSLRLAVVRLPLFVAVPKVTVPKLLD